MAGKKIIFFTAGQNPTVNEAADIAKLNALASESYVVVVRDGSKPNDQKYGAGPEEADYVAFTSPMTKPAAYAAKTQFDPAKPLAGGNLTATQQIVSTGQVITGVTVTGSGTTATFTVAGGKVTGIVLS